MALSLAPLALGVRLSSVRGYAAAARSALLALTVAGLTVVALYAAAAPAVIGAQYDRAVARAPIVVSESPSVSLWYGERPNTWAGHDVTQAYVLGGERAPAPPGVARLPQPGEVWLSPALVELAEDDRVIAALFDGYRQVGTISLEGLLRPGELRAVVGIDRPRQWMYPISAYGTDEGPFFDDPLSASPVVLLVGGMLVVLVVSPALALLVLTAQVSAAARRTRVLALRTLGMTPGRTRVVVAVETTLVALPAAVAGLVGFLLARPHIASVPTTGYDFFAAEANVPISVLVGMPVLFAVLTTAIAIVSVPAVPRDTVRPLLHRPAPRRLSLLFAAVGGAGLLALPFIPDFLGGQTGTFVLTGATVCLALGLPLGAPALVSGAARRLARVAPRAGGLLGFRSSAAEPGLAVRMIASGAM
ncbi:MAG: ABC transporter permease [Nocardioidaceae bacterium]|nr:ABC transporter permease [Nocardioidaceae bacterium]